MSTSAIIAMVLIQGTVTLITLRIYYLVMNPPKKQEGENQESEAETR